jgi:transcriptional regulator with XRE-family HTH domain
MSKSNNDEAMHPKGHTPRHTAPDLRRVLARQVRGRMEALGESVTVVAARTGCSRGTLHAILRADVATGIVRIYCLSEALQSTPAHLLDGTGTQPICDRPLASSHPPLDVRLVLARNLTFWRVRSYFPSIEALALAALVSKSQLYLILKGRHDTSIDTIDRLAKALDIAPAQLVSKIEPHG